MVLSISGIIPTLNEAVCLGKTLAAVRAEHPREILVVDGGSSDATCEAARAADRLLQRPRGRAAQMNEVVAHAAGVMCRTTLSVGWDGRLYDCDFNQMLELDLAPGLARHIRDFDAAALSCRPIVTAPHCRGCTTGSGSGCQGSIVNAP